LPYTPNTEIGNSLLHRHYLEELRKQANFNLMKECNKCDQVNSENARICRHCGYEFYSSGGLMHMFPAGKPRRIAAICMSLLVTLFIAWVLSGTSTGIGGDQFLLLVGVFVVFSVIGLLAG
jgi:ribosomal protein L40E